ncbi:NAD(P)-binding protein [Dendrothele bispora CBS 962.96]|uniref:NAD(P)-binding protein n=1 Tax=Dendrothele bispora (strain CBS 962.96) TaxID=1314807 RepID=A0A4S8L6H5_DENBC|nr:NAD(P)-binding protein [Dendrothele bispora CBS 962.96]
MSAQLVWLITGTSSGLGRELTLATLERGDKVIATARGRSMQKLEDLKAKGADVLELDVTVPLDKLKEVAKQAVNIHGRIDVVVNNAGYVQVGMLEECTPKETLNQFNTNVFGGLNVARAFLPYMRQRKTGTFVWLGSLAGWTAIPIGSLYVGTKAALRRISESLDEEIKPLGLRSACIEPGHFRTPVLSRGHRTDYQPRIQDYAEMTKEINDGLIAFDNMQPGDPVKCAQIIVDIVRGEGVAKDKPFPKNLQLGSDCYAIAKASAEESLQTLELWKDVISSTDYKD